MIETHSSADQNAKTTAQPRKILHRIKNERTAGSMPSWQRAETPKQHIQQALENAQKASFKNTLNNAIAYTGTNNASETAPTEEFKFGDLIDMVNPLHHIPVVGHIYRKISHDEIKPISQIMGGALFGGPLGAASGLINTVIETETGKDLTGNALSMVIDGQAPDFKNIPDHPQKRLNHANKIAQNGTKTAPDLPASLLSFTNPAQSTDITIKRHNATTPPTQNTHHIRQPITQVHLTGLYALSSEQNTTN